MVHIQELPSEVLCRVFRYCPEAVSKGVVPLLNKWFRAFVHQTARPVAALRREMLLHNLVFTVGALKWPGSRVCQRTTDVARMRPLVRSRPTRADPDFAREPGDIPLSINALGVDSTLVWDALPERVRAFLGMTRMTLQLREVSAPIGFATLQLLLAELQAEARGLDACTAAREQMATTYERLAAVLRQSTDKFLVVSFPLLGRHGARLGVRPQKEMVHILVPMGDGVLPTAQVTPMPGTAVVASLTGAVSHTLAVTEFVVSYGDVAERLRRYAERAPRPVDDPVLRTQLRVKTVELLPAASEFRHLCAIAAERQVTLGQVSVAAQKQAAGTARALRRTPRQHQSRRLSKRLVPLERIERMCGELYALAVAAGTYSPEVVNFALCHTVALGTIAFVPLRCFPYEFSASETLYMGHLSVVQQLQRQFGIVDRILAECMGVQRAMVLSGGIEAYPVNFGRPEPPRFVLVDHSFRDAGAGDDRERPCVIGRVGDEVRPTEEDSRSSFLFFFDMMVGDELTAHITNTFEPRHWVSVLDQHTSAVPCELQTLPQSQTRRLRPHLGVTEFLMTLAKYALDRSRLREHAWAVGNQTARHAFLENRVRRSVSGYYGQLVARGFPQDYCWATAIRAETGTLLGPGGIRVRPVRTNVGANERVRVLPGRVVFDGAVKVPVCTGCGLFLLLCEANLATDAPRWVGPGRAWAPQPPAPDTGRALVLDLLKACMVELVPCPRASQPRRGAVSIDRDAIVANTDPRAGFSELVYDRPFCDGVIEEWYSNGATAKPCIDRRMLSTSNARLSVLYHYLTSRFVIADALQRTL